MGEYNFSEDMRTAELTLFTFNMRSPLKLVRSSICVGINEKATKPHTSLPIATISYPIHSSLVSASLEEAPLDAFSTIFGSKHLVYTPIALISFLCKSAFASLSMA